MNTSQTPHRQRGSVLIVSLIMLLLLTILSVSSMSGNLMQERMASNANEYALAFAAAESALRRGESWLDPLTENPQTGTGGLPNRVWTTGTIWAAGTGPDMVYRGNNSAWWTANGIPLTNGGGSPLPLVAAQPLYTIHHVAQRNSGGSLSRPPDEYFYEVTARGVGRSQLSAVIVQSTYRRRF